MARNKKTLENILS